MRLPGWGRMAAAAAILAAATLLRCVPAAAQARADEPGSGRVSGARTIEWPRWPLASLASAARTPLFTADQEACFGRVYDQPHLARHPNQKVTGIHIFRSLSERPEAENWQPNQRDEAIKRFRESGETSVQAFVTFRDRKGYFHNALTCNKETRNGVGCYIECDGGSFDIKRESPTTALLSNKGFVLIGGCGEELEESEWVYFSPGKDDKVFRLESKPAAVCRAEEQKAKPIRAGKPLRERFGETETFCFGRDYDAAHMAKHPQQQVASIRVGRLAPGEERRDKDLTQRWPEDVKLSVSLTLKAASTRRALKYVCNPLESSWECHVESTADTRSTCDSRAVQLARGPGDDIMLINREDGLPIDAPCEAKPTAEPSNEEFARRKTRSDDKTFRLTRMPNEACR
jgi:hypothetical protein